MIWLKRILPLLLIAGGWFFYTGYKERTDLQNERLTEKYALITAKVWLYSAEYRNDSDGFIRARDSLLKASGVTEGEIEQYLKKNRKRPEYYTPYIRKVKTYIDSLSGGGDTVMTD